ncbi:MAG: FAD-dependent thymidylate synthase, partial [Dehalococcoidia bacterium]
TSPLPTRQLMDRETPQEAAKLINRLISAGHLSPLEHASFTFSLEGISRVTSHQLVRHRLASYTQRSQRYVRMGEPKFVTPPSLSATPELRSRFEDGVRAAFGLYSELVEAGVAEEDARYLLPSAMETEVVMTMNARELIAASALRLCPRAQWEIVALFEEIKAETTKVASTIGNALKPKCYKLGYCDEFRSCGLFPTLKETARAN